MHINKLVLKERAYKIGALLEKWGQMAKIKEITWIKKERELCFCVYRTLKEPGPDLAPHALIYTKLFMSALLLR